MKVLHLYRYLLFVLISAFLSGPLMAQEGEISAERKAAIDSLALEKIRDLSRYITIIGNRSTPVSESNRVIERALELFVEDAEIGVSSLYREKINNYPVRTYLNRLRALNYDRVTIRWYNIQYISDLERQPDGRYVGVVTIYQRFEGESDDGLQYKDNTKKDITVYVERKQTQIGGELIGFWDVLLGDIRVVETTP